MIMAQGTPPAFLRLISWVRCQLPGSLRLCFFWHAALRLQGHKPPWAESPSGVAPRAVTVARATSMPQCAVFVDAANSAGGDGTAARPHATIAAAIAAAQPGAVICVAEGTYAESLSPGAKHFTLAGGFQRGKSFTVRDSAAFPTRAQGKGGSFLRFEDPSPTGDNLVAIDGFEITGYGQAIFRDF